VVKTRGAKVVAEVLVKPFILSQHDAGNDCPPLAVEPWCERPVDATPQGVREPSDPAPMANDAVFISAEHDVDALPPQIGSLVESLSLLGATGEAEARDHLEQRSLRRRAAARKLQARRLVRALRPEPVHPDRDPYGERATACRPRHLD